MLTDFQPKFAQTVLRWNIARLMLQDDFILPFCCVVVPYPRSAYELGMGAICNIIMHVAVEFLSVR